MRPDAPRLAPLAPDEIDPEVRRLLGLPDRPEDAPVLNIFATLAHHPKLLKRWLVFGSHVLGRSSLAPRDREILILRMGWLCRSAYEWGQHVLIGRQTGLSDEEIARVAEGPDAPGWDERERALLRAADELRADACVGDATWQALARHYTTQQLLDLVFTAGQYNLVAMALNTLGVQPEPGLPPLPDPGPPPRPGR